jgi:hypothetical protein
MTKNIYVDVGWFGGSNNVIDTPFQLAVKTNSFTVFLGSVKVKMTNGLNISI